MSTVDAAAPLARDLAEIFGNRLKALVAYGPPAAELHTLAIVDRFAPQDLDACAAKAAAWHERQIATPLFLAAHEFEDSLDAFPLEFGAIIAEHTVVAGADPFAGLAVDAADVRRACEIQARSHLLHLREGYVESRGNDDALARLILESAKPFAALVRSIERLERDGHRMRHDAEAEISRLAAARALPPAEAKRLFSRYLAAVEAIVTYVNGWSDR
jgi:hypothetical protein